ncbi:MAG: hypothetical protein IAE79_09560 [Anaerolinea sp.]|nr:hypothetical protein [Anaerolinea sp.]
MTIQTRPKSCFNCNRTEYEIPVVLWTYQERPLPVCSACIPTLIHKWEQIVTALNAQVAGENHE